MLTLMRFDITAMGSGLGLPDLGLPMAWERRMVTCLLLRNAVEAAVMSLGSSLMPEWGWL